MNTAKIYYDIDGNECTIHQMVEREPQWAATRIQEGERAIAKAKVLEARVAELETDLRDWLQWIKDELEHIESIEGCQNTFAREDIQISEDLLSRTPAQSRIELEKQNAITEYYTDRRRPQSRAEIETDDDLFYVWDRTRGYVGNSLVWWRVGNSGYSPNLDEAKKFTRAELIGMADDLSAFPCQVVDQHAERHACRQWRFMGFGFQLGTDYDQAAQIRAAADGQGGGE